VTEGPHAGFQEVSGIGMEVAVVEYRNGNARENGVIKMTGLTRYPDVTLRRGLVGSLHLYNWIDQIRNGDQAALRTVTIQLQNEDHTQIVQEWKLLRASSSTSAVRSTPRATMSRSRRSRSRTSASSCNSGQASRTTTDPRSHGGAA
jgi:phage tail-like protein